MFNWHYYNFVIPLMVSDIQKSECRALSLSLHFLLRKSARTMKTLLFERTGATSRARLPWLKTKNKIYLCK